MNKTIVTVIVIILFVVIVILGLRFLSGEDDWICQNGQWVKHGAPAAAKPTTPCP